MLNLSKKAASHEEVFLSRYQQLVTWSLKMASHDRDKAEDLVHDAYIQWTLVRPDLESIHNLDGYLYGMLRNMHAAELRRSLRHPTASLSVIEYDSALLSLQRASDELHIAGLQDQLRTVCDYACARKETSKAGSLLLLRFFHGYYPGEAAQIAGIRRVTVDSWLRIARSEAKLYLENPDALKFIKESGIRSVADQHLGAGNGKGWALNASSNGKAQEFLDEISQRIFQSCQSRCLSNKKLRGFYLQPDPEPLDCEALAHIASCKSCLDKATKVLKFPPKDDHYPPDRLGRDPRPGEKSLFSRNGRRKTAGPHALRGHLEEILEHRPKELHVAVNGFTVGTHKLTSDRIEHTQKLSLPEQIGLVEILSEQGIRLLCLYVEPPPEGAITQAAHVELSDDRMLGVGLSFHEPWPQLELTYSDPYFADVAGDPELIKNEDIKENDKQRASSRLKRTNEYKARVSARLLPLFNNIYSKPQRFWLRPGAVSALIALVVALALVLTHKAPPPIAAEVLQDAAAAEAAAYIQPGQVGRRQMNFEQRRLADGALLAQGRVEIWRDAAKGNTAHRLYDHSGSLVAGAWQRGQSAPQEIFYNHGSKLIVSQPSQDAPQLVLSDHAWLLEPSAANFSTLVRHMDSAAIETRDNNYLLHYRERSSGTANDERRLVAASLILDRTTLHAISEVLVIAQGAQGNERVELKFTESSFERLPAASIDQKVFEPDTQLLSGLVQSAPEHAPLMAANAKPLINSVLPPPSLAELTSLEVNVLYLLDQINANAGEQVEIRRLASGELLVQALVETDGRKSEILKALAPVAGNPRVRREVLTIEEALRRQTGKSNVPATLDRVVITADRIPVYEEVRRYLERDGRLRLGADKNTASSGDVDNEIQRFSGRMIDQSRQALLHAFALKHLVERFSTNDLNSLSDESRRKWYEMIKTHAHAFRESTRVLRCDLAPIFARGENSQNDSGGDVILNDAALVEAVDKLAKLALTNDEAISQAFALHPDAKGSVSLGGNVFWSTFTRAENLAAALERIESPGSVPEKR